MQELIMQEFKYERKIMRINTDLPPGEGLGFLGPPSWTSNSFNLLSFLPPEMVSPVVLHELPSL